MAKVRPLAAGLEDLRCASDRPNGGRCDPAERSGPSPTKMLRLAYTGLLVVIGGSFHFGYQISLINPLADVLQDFIRTSLQNRTSVDLDETTLRIIWPSIAGLLFVGAFAGASIAPFFMERLGVRSAFNLASLVLSVSFVIAAISPFVGWAEPFILGRFLSGVGIGMATTVQTVYLTEISPVPYRGVMGTLTGFSTSIGFVIASGVGLPQILGQRHLWHWAYIIEALPTIAITLATFTGYLPESPAYCLKRGRDKAALKCLKLYHERDDATERLRELAAEVQATSSTKVPGFVELFKCKESRAAIFISLLLNATVSFSGILAVSFFGTFLLQAIGFTEQKAALANCLASFAGILGNVAGSYTIDKIGRRILLIGSLACLVVLNALLMILVFVFQRTRDVNTGYAFLLVFMVFLFVFSLGVGPLAWFIATELSSVASRPRIQSMSVSCQYLTCFVSPMIFFPFYQSAGAISFLLFIVPLAVTSVYLHFYLPETRKKSIDDIIAELSRS